MSGHYVRLPYAQFSSKGLPFESINNVVRLRAAGVRSTNSTKSCSQRPLGLDDLDGLLGCFTRFHRGKPVKCLVKNSCNTWRDGFKPVVWDFRFVNSLRSGWFFVGVLVTVLDPFFPEGQTEDPNGAGASVVLPQRSSKDLLTAVVSFLYILFIYCIYIYIYSTTIILLWLFFHCIIYYYSYH